MNTTYQLAKFAQELDKAAKDAPKAFKAFRKTVAKRYFELLDQNAPPDDEGRLRASLKRKPFKGEKEWIETYRKGEIEIGTDVYYATMLNDGHITGKRPVSMRGHRKMSPSERRRIAEAHTKKKAWVDGVFFREKAEQTFEGELPKMVDDWSTATLEEVL